MNVRNHKETYSLNDMLMGIDAKESHEKQTSETQRMIELFRKSLKRVCT